MEENYQYNKVAKAISFIRNHFKDQPKLKDIAGLVNSSEFHFQKVFSEWAGVSPKKFLQYITIDYAKARLKKDQLNLFDVSHDSGLSGTGRLHDLFVNIEGMTPATYRDKGQNLKIGYCSYKTPFGNMLAASTEKGICFAAFYNEIELVLSNFYEEFPAADIFETPNGLHSEISKVFQREGVQKPLNLHVNGTAFHLKVWEALLKIPEGGLSTYGDIAKEIGNPKASRAVGTAIGNNPITFLIPCHRVIRSSGQFGGYRWDPERKMAMIGYEAALNNKK